MCLAVPRKSALFVEDEQRGLPRGVVDCNGTCKDISIDYTTEARLVIYEASVRGKLEAAKGCAARWQVAESQSQLSPSAWVTCIARSSKDRILQSNEVIIGESKETALQGSNTAPALEQIAQGSAEPVRRLKILTVSEQPE